MLKQKKIKKDNNDPKLVIIAGPNGSGKTTITDFFLDYLSNSDYVYVNPDKIAQEQLNGWNNRDSIIEAAKIAELQRNNCIENRQNLLFETVFSAPDKIEFIKKAQQNGYKVHLYFIGTDSPAINAERVAYRIRQGGHGVPIEKIISRYFKSIAQLNEAMDIVDECIVMDNSISGKKPKTIIKVEQRKEISIYESSIPAWISEIVDSLLKRNFVMKDTYSQDVKFPKP